LHFASVSWLKYMKAPFLYLGARKGAFMYFGNFAVIDGGRPS